MKNYSINDDEYITYETPEQESQDETPEEIKKNHNWTREDLEEIYSMSFHNHTVLEIANYLNRPYKSVLRALRRIQTQQAMYHSMSDVAAAHNMNIEKLSKRLKDTLYYIPIETNEFPHIITITSIVFGVVSLYGYMFYTP